MKLPNEGLEREVILETLADYKAEDLDWRSGRVFSYVFDAGEAAKDVAREAAGLFLFENGLDPTVFRSLLRMENEVVGLCVAHANGGEAAVGNFTSGGTESILLAVKSARDHARATRPGVTAPEMVLADTAHAAFHKAAHYLGVKAVVVPCRRETFEADVAAMTAAVTDQTVLLVASAPSYAHGVMDDVEALGAHAVERGLWLHVDGCMGGFVLPYLERLGEDVPRFDFRVPGVASLSMDLHKYAYAPKGASVILYRDKTLRRSQLYACADWTGYTMVNSTVQSTKSGAPLAAAWAVLHYLGDAGYLELARATRDATRGFIEGIEAHPDLRVLGRPVMGLVAFTSEAVNVFHVADEMKALGWHVQPQLGRNASPPNLHMTIMAANAPHVARWVEDLGVAVERARALPSGGALVGAIGDAVASLDPETVAPETLVQMLRMAGIGTGGLPGRMAEVNEVMNRIPPRLSERLLTEYWNELFTPA
jgi:sphinganine-1-phosphate aldolase